MGIRYSVCCHCRNTISFFPGPPDDGIWCSKCGVHNSAETINRINAVLEDTYHTNRRPRIRCITKDCSNHSDEGRFVGDLCSPCFEFITKGDGAYSQIYRNAHKLLRIDEASKLIKSNIDEARARYSLSVDDQSKLKNTVDGYMKFISGSEYRSYEVICDERNNPPSEIDAGKLNIDIFIKSPSKALIESFDRNNVPFEYINQ